MDFIKDSAVKTVNGIKTEFAKTAKRERQNGHAADLYAKTESNQNGLQTETAKRSQNGIKPKRIQNGFETESKRKRLKRKRKTVKRQNGQNGKIVRTNGRTAERTKGRTNGRTDKRTNGRTEYFLEKNIF